MVEEVECRPDRILVKSRRPLPEKIIKHLQSILEIPLSVFRGDCGPRDLVVYSPNTGKPPARCRSIKLPHLGLLSAFMISASRHWCDLVNDPETFYYKFIISEANSLYKNYKPAWSGKPPLPKHPPPILVASEIYVHDASRAILEAYRRASSGADIIVLGGDRRSRKSELVKAVREIARDYNVFVDASALVSPSEVYELEAVGFMSLTPCEFEAVEEGVRGDLAFVVIPRRLAGARERMLELRDAFNDARRLGFKKLIADPVLQPVINPGSLEGLYAASLLSSSSIGPVMLGINNVYELLDADTPGSIALLVSMAGEAGSSMVLVSEESGKSLGATIEAVTASRMASLALHFNSPPKDYPYRLLVSKEKGRYITG